MGFTDIYLIGMDFDYVIPKSHERRGDLIVSTTDDPNHFHKDYFGKGKTWKDPKLDRVAMNYRQAKISYEAVGRRIYNSTIGGRLEIFERADFAALFDDERPQQNVSALLARSLNATKVAAQRSVDHAGRSLSGRSPVAASVPDTHKRSASEKRAARLAKLRRDPHLFFADSKSPALRLLRHLFGPTGVGKTEAELTQAAGKGGK